MLSLAASLAACAAEDDGPTLEAPGEDARAPRSDATSALDGPTEAAVDAAMDVALDASLGAAPDTTADLAADTRATDGPLVDAVPVVDTRPVCTPTRTSCNMALECGAIPNGCPGGTFRCAECGGGETWCATMTSRWQTRVYNCTQQAQREHSEWFDPTMFRDSSSWLVLAASARAYVMAVAQCADGRGAVAVVDRNAPENEVRLKGTDDDIAENFIVRTYGTGRTAGRYTSACTPAMF